MQLYFAALPEHKLHELYAQIAGFSPKNKVSKLYVQLEGAYTKKVANKASKLSLYLQLSCPIRSGVNKKKGGMVFVGGATQVMGVINSFIIFWF